jgi:hypothetical protein
MNQYIVLMLAGTLFLPLGIEAQTGANTNSQNSYNWNSGSVYPRGQEYQLQRPNQGIDQDFPPTNPSSQGEESFMRNAQRRYEQETQSNMNMIERDRMMMERGYDPNETFNYNQREQFRNPPGQTQQQQQTHITYPTNAPGASKEILDNAEARLRGGYSNRETQYNPEQFSNPYENQPRNTTTQSQKNR